MPLYEYQCNECGRRTEKIQKFSDEPLTVCPHCGGRLERTLTAPAVQFKGGGWYKDLYSSTKPSGSGGSESAKSGEGAKTSEGGGAAASSSSGGSDASSSSSGTASPPAPSTAPSKS